MAAPQQWWVVWTVPGSGIKFGQRQFHVIEASAPPKDGSNVPGEGFVVQVEGPYQSKTAAEAAVGSSTGTTGTGPGIANPNTQANQPAAIPNPFAGLLEVGHWIGDLVTALTDIHMWISLAWLLLGLLLVVVAIWVLARREGIAPSAVPVPVPV